jgi:phosphoribosylformylglycinamidine synthase
MLADTSWGWRQYDHQLFLNTVAGPGSDATLLRLKDPRTGADTGRGLALTTDGNHRWCAVDPHHGTARLVSEGVLNLACVGARPLALVNNLNFGNPEHPAVMWELVSCIDGMAEACRAHDVPVVGGNVSLYNETAGHDIDPTPVVGLLGIVDRLERRPPGLALHEGDALVLLGDDPHPAGGLAGSRWAWESGARGGSLAPVDHGAVAAVAAVVRGLVADGLLAGVHDVAEGGLALCLAELAVASGVGLEASGVPSAAVAFSESPGRVVVVVAPDRVEEVLTRARAAGVPASVVGVAGGARLLVGTPDPWVLAVPVADLQHRWRHALPDAFGVAAAH